MIRLTYFWGRGFAAQHVTKQFSDIDEFRTFLHKEHDTLIHHAEDAFITGTTYEEEEDAEDAWETIIALDGLKVTIQNRIAELQKCVAAERHWLDSVDRQVETHKQSLQKHEQQLEEAEQQLEKLHD